MALDDREYIFISYSHEKPDWRERILTFLKPWVRDGELTVWADTYIKVGELWRREINRALSRTRVAVLLVSQEFLASDFIVSEELPALFDTADRGLATLICVPVSSTTLRAPLPEARLLDFQWPRPPDEPLDLLDEAERNQALAEITNAIIDAAGVAQNGQGRGRTDQLEDRRTVTALAPATDDTPVGELHDVPPQRPYYVERDEEINAIRSALVSVEHGAVGITSPRQRVGLHGRGGIGKSVLAIALANDSEIRRSFPGGVYWVTVGQEPDLVALQVGLAHSLGDHNPVVTDVVQGEQLLRELWGDRSGLLILDDVWVLGHVRYLDVSNAASRVLITTRDGTLVTGLGAFEVSIEALGDADALQLLGSWAGQPVECLPDDAAQVAVECGNLPLALSVAGALVRDGSPWSDVLSALQAGKLRFLEHPSGSVFASMRLSVDFLSDELKRRYFELAVFPEDADIPEKTVCRLWAQTAGLADFETRRHLMTLARKGLLYFERPKETGASVVSFHDLQHDFLRLVAEDIKGLHEALVDAYFGRSLAGVAGATDV